MLSDILGRYPHPVLKSSTLARLMADVGPLTKTERIKRQFSLHAELAHTYARSRREMNNGIAAAKGLLQSDDSARALWGGLMPASSPALGDFLNELEEISEKLDASFTELKRRVERRINELLPGTFDIGSGSELRKKGASDEAIADAATDTTEGSDADAVAAVDATANAVAAAAGVALLFGPPGVFVAAFLGGAAIGLYGSILFFVTAEGN